MISPDLAEQAAQICVQHIHADIGDSNPQQCSSDTLKSLQAGRLRLQRILLANIAVMRQATMKTSNAVSPIEHFRNAYSC